MNINDTKYFRDYVIDIFKENCYAEDSRLYIKNKLKYELHNLIQDLYPIIIDELYDELEVDIDE